MLSVDQLEQLAIYREGGGSAAEREELSRLLEADPEWKAGLKQLEQLEALVEALPASKPLPEPALPAARYPIMNRSVRSLRFAVAAALVLISTAGVWLLRAQHQNSVTALGPVRVEGRSLVLGDSLESPSPVLLETDTGAAVVRTAAGQSVLVAPHSVVLGTEVPELKQGVVVVRGHGLRALAGEAQVSIDGVVVLAMEPAGGEPRVTGVVASMTPEELMHTGWMKLTGVGGGMAVLGSALTVWVVQGSATASTRPADQPVTVSAGQQWTAGDAVAHATAKADAPTVAAEAAPSAPTSPTLVAPGTFATMTRPQLEATAERLSNEKEALLRERAELKKKLEDADDQHPKARNYYTFEPAELQKAAARGELRLRGPQLGREPFSLAAEVKKDLSITADEEKTLKAAHEASVERARQAVVKLYVEMGGAPSLADGLSNEALMNEIRLKAAPGDYADAVRQLANERAGIAAPTSPEQRSVIERALRTFMDEDARLIHDTDEAVGPRRAEALLNHEKSGHSNHTFGVGPPKPDEKK